MIRRCWRWGLARKRYDDAIGTASVGHPAFLGSTFGASVIDRLDKTDRNLGQNPPHRFEAYAGGRCRPANQRFRWWLRLSL